jgi:hypothetical protein
MLQWGTSKVDQNKLNMREVNKQEYKPTGIILYTHPTENTLKLTRNLCPSHFTLGKTQYPLNRRFGGSQGWSELVQKISSPLEFNH